MKAKRLAGARKFAQKSWTACPIGLLITSLCSCGSSQKVRADDPSSAPRVAVVKAVRRSISSTLEIAAEFQPFQEIDVYAKVSGYIQKLYID
jgi:multidrug efflux pump subunit AcrA (membrane-fusion protein)